MAANLKAPSRPPVTRERAVRAAIALADADGIASLSMRKLAGRLGVEAMSLYYHVRNKGDLLDGMIEQVYSEITTPAENDDWKPAMRRRAESTREVLGRHPWAISMIDERTTVAGMTQLNAVIATLRNAGFSMALAAHAMSLLDSYTHGFSLQEASLPTDSSGDISEVTEAILAQQQLMSELPHLAQMGVELVMQPGYAYGNEFEFGIDLILDGIERAHADSSRPHI
jgi:AcrR family transcriptional regulator